MPVVTVSIVVDAKPLAALFDDKERRARTDVQRSGGELLRIGRKKFAAREQHEAGDPRDENHCRNRGTDTTACRGTRLHVRFLILNCHAGYPPWASRARR
jgi:hypothetical protein